MFNPFVPFTTLLLTQIMQQKRFYLISQSYIRGQPGVYDKKAMLLSDYTDKGLAMIHYNALKAKQDSSKQKDTLIGFVNLLNDDHLRRVHNILLADSDYAVYANFIKDEKTSVREAAKLYTARLEKHVRNVTTWQQIGQIKPSLNVRFGELFFDVKYGSQHLQVFLDELDNKYPLA